MLNKGKNVGQELSFLKLSSSLHFQTAFLWVGKEKIQNVFFDDKKSDVLKSFSIEKSIFIDLDETFNTF